MKLNKCLSLAFLSVVLISTAAFAMGGPAVEPSKKAPVTIQAQTTESQTINVSWESSTSEAKNVLASLEVESDVYNGYLMVLNRKIIEAQKAGDLKKLSELNAMERDMSDHAGKVGLKISTIQKEHPELNPVEENPVDLTGNTEEAGSSELDNSDATTAETAKKTAKPKQVKKPQSVKHVIVYYVVKKGDTLKSISKKFFNGSDAYYKGIAQMNGITKVKQFKVGKKLKIDKSMKKPAKSPKKPSKPSKKK